MKKNISRFGGILILGSLFLNSTNANGVDFSLLETQLGIEKIEVQYTQDRYEQLLDKAEELSNQGAYESAEKAIYEYYEKTFFPGNCRVLAIHVDILKLSQNIKALPLYEQRYRYCKSELSPEEENAYIESYLDDSIYTDKYLYLWKQYYYSYKHKKIVGDNKYNDSINALYVQLLQERRTRIRPKEHFDALLGSDHLYTPFFLHTYAHLFKDEINTQRYKEILQQTLQYENKSYTNTEFYKSTNDFVYSRLSEIEDDPSKKLYYAMRALEIFDSLDDPKNLIEGARDFYLNNLNYSFSKVLKHASPEALRLFSPYLKEYTGQDYATLVDMRLSELPIEAQDVKIYTNLLQKMDLGTPKSKQNLLKKYILSKKYSDKSWNSLCQNIGGDLESMGIDYDNFCNMSKEEKKDGIKMISLILIPLMLIILLCTFLLYRKSKAKKSSGEEQKKSFKRSSQT